jgi:hypothetical protein
VLGTALISVILGKYISNRWIIDKVSFRRWYYGVSARGLIFIEDINNNAWQCEVRNGMIPEAI